MGEEVRVVNCDRAFIGKLNVPTLMHVPGVRRVRYEVEFEMPNGWEREGLLAMIDMAIAEVLKARAAGEILSISFRRHRDAESRQAPVHREPAATPAPPPARKGG